MIFSHSLANISQKNNTQKTPFKQVLSGYREKVWTIKATSPSGW